MFSLIYYGRPHLLLSSSIWRRSLFPTRRRPMNTTCFSARCGTGQLISFPIPNLPDCLFGMHNDCRNIMERHSFDFIMSHGLQIGCGKFRYNQSTVCQSKYLFQKYSPDCPQLVNPLALLFTLTRQNSRRLGQRKGTLSLHAVLNYLSM